MNTERGTYGEKESRNKLIVTIPRLTPRGEWFLIDSTFGFSFPRNRGTWMKPTVSFICDRQVNIRSDNSTNKPASPNKPPGVSTYNLSTHLQDQIEIDTQSKHLIKIVRISDAERIVRVEITSNQPITLQQGLSDMEIFEILEQKLVRETGIGKEYFTEDKDSPTSP